MSVSITFFLTLIPILFQLIVGSIAVARPTRLKFGYVSLISLVSQMLFSYLLLHEVNKDLFKDGPRCGMPLFAMFCFAIFLFIILVIIILIQWLIHRKKQRRQALNSEK